MDEYLFITVAKLKADRLQFERERAAASFVEPPLEALQPSTTRTARQAPSSGWFSRAPQWREQS